MIYADSTAVVTNCLVLHKNTVPSDLHYSYFSTISHWLLSLENDLTTIIMYLKKFKSGL